MPSQLASALRLSKSGATQTHAAAASSGWSVRTTPRFPFSAARPPGLEEAVIRAAGGLRRAARACGGRAGRTGAPTLAEDRPAGGGTGPAQKKLGQSLEERRALIALHPELSIRRQCQLLNLHRSGLAYESVSVSARELELRARLDRIYTAHPEYGVRRKALALAEEAQMVNAQVCAPTAAGDGLGSDLSQTRAGRDGARLNSPRRHWIAVGHRTWQFFPQPPTPRPLAFRPRRPSDRRAPAGLAAAPPFGKSGHATPPPSLGPARPGCR